MTPRIMVLDDDAGIRQSLFKLLRLEGYDVVLAADGQEAISGFDPQQIHLLLLDLNLPGKSGWDVFERVTALEPLLPIIVITGRDKQFDIASGAGVGALMEKPLDIPLLLKTIAALLAEPPQSRLKRLAGVEASMRYFPTRTRPASFLHFKATSGRGRRPQSRPQGP